MKKTALAFCILMIVALQTIQAQNAPVSMIGNLLMNATTISVPIKASNFTNISSCNLKLVYNPAVLQATSVSIGSGVGGNINSNISVAGKIYLGWYRVPAISMPDNSTIFTVNFQRIGPGLCNISFDDSTYCAYSRGSLYLNDSPFTNFYQNGTVSVLPSNAPHTFIAATTAVPGNLVTLPIKVNSLMFVGNLSLLLTYNPSVLSYVSAVNNSSFPSLSVNASQSGSLQISGNSSAFNGFSLADSSVLCSLNFSYLGGCTALNWFDNGISCQYSGPQNTPIYNDSPQSTYYTNASVVPDFEISGDSAVCPATTATYSVSNVNGCSFQWLVNGGTILSGATTHTVDVSWNSTTVSASISVIETYANNSFLATKTINIIPLPTPQIIGAIAVSNSSNNETYTTPATASLYYWTLSGGTILSGQGSNTIHVDWTTCQACTSATISLTETTASPAACSGTTVLNVSISNIFYSLSGQLTYDNQLATPLNGQTIKLINSLGYEIATTTTTTYVDNSIPANPLEVKGYYQFNAIHPGSYTLKTIINNIPWGGVNATDALHIKRHVVGLSYLYDLPLVAADINLSGTVNSTDALLLQLRAVGIISQFVGGDWVLGDTLVSVAGNTVHNLKILAMGDVNKSYVPNTLKAINSIQLQKEGILELNESAVIEVPIRVADYLMLGALSLDLGFDPRLVEIKDLKSTLKGIVYKITEGEILLCWSDTKAVQLQPNDILCTLLVKAKTSLTASMDVFSFSAASEFTDENAKQIQFSPLKVCSLETNAEDFAIKLYPNPCRDNIKIEYKLTEAAQVKLSIYNAVAQNIAVLEDSYKAPGSYQLNFNTSDFKPGIHRCEMLINGATLHLQKNTKLLKIN